MSIHQLFRYVRLYPKDVTYIRVLVSSRSGQISFYYLLASLYTGGLGDVRRFGYTESEPPHLIFLLPQDTGNGPRHIDNALVVRLVLLCMTLRTTLTADL